MHVKTQDFRGGQARAQSKSEQPKSGRAEYDIPPKEPSTEFEFPIT